MYISTSAYDFTLCLAGNSRASRRTAQGRTQEKASPRIVSERDVTSTFLMEKNAHSSLPVSRFGQPCAEPGCFGSPCWERFRLCAAGKGHACSALGFSVLPAGSCGASKQTGPASKMAGRGCWSSGPPGVLRRGQPSASHQLVESLDPAKSSFHSPPTTKTRRPLRSF